MAMKRDISKQDTTRIKIELAGAEIRKENKRRKKIDMEPISPSFIGVSTRRMVTQSNKILCGKLSVLCDTMRWNGITYPWRPQEVSR